MEQIWNQIRPYYDKLYAYVRMKLRADSPFKDHIPKCGKIPIHVTGNVWGQVWSKLEQWAKPYPKASSMDITPLMKDKVHNVNYQMQLQNFFLSTFARFRVTLQKKCFAWQTNFSVGLAFRNCQTISGKSLYLKRSLA